MDRKVLITGASGFLGKIISNELIKSGYRLLTLGKQDVNDIQVDLTKVAFQIPSTEKIDTVIHAAGKAHYLPKSPSEIKDFFDVNFEGTKNLCNSITSSQCKLKAFIFISSVAVYGIDSGEFITEDYALNGSTPYARSKILAEEWLQQWASENDITLSILRLPLVAGFNPPGNLGAMIKGISSGRYVSIGKATARKSMVWAEDIAYIIPQLAEKGGIYNLTDGYHPSFDELEFSIASALKKKAPLKIPLSMAKGIAFLGNFLGSRSPINSDKLKKIISTLTFDDTKAKTLLNWRPNSVLDKLPSII
ncbi:MAG: UDP-galactose-4-epimerase [Mucilaginibacter sp.]|nr:UDP-galactose-4-epimerase [Mucilaginibacter sp.]